MKIAIMQPYFIPYPGYFRLFCAADLFVIYDCVQFPRRSWVHRNQLLNSQQQLDWLTLPLQKASFTAAIQELNFRQNASTEWQAQLNASPAMQKLNQKHPTLYNVMTDLSTTPVNYIVNTLREICRLLQLPFNIAYSSQLNLSADLRGQDRIIEIVKAHQGTDYVNASGGRELYQAEAFASQNIKLHFLPEYKGEYCSIIQYFIDHDPITIRNIIMENL